MKSIIIYSAVAISTTTLALIPFSANTSSSIDVTENTTASIDEDEIKAKQEAEEKKLKEEQEKKEKEAKEAEEEKAKAEKEETKQKEEKAKQEAEQKEKQEKEQQEQQEKELKEQQEAQKKAEEKAKEDAKKKESASRNFPNQDVIGSVISGGELELLRTRLNNRSISENSDFVNCAKYVLNAGNTDVENILYTNCGDRYDGDEIKVVKSVKYSFGLSEREINATIDQLRYKTITSKDYGIALRVNNLGILYQFEMIEVYK